LKEIIALNSKSEHLRDQWTAIIIIGGPGSGKTTISRSFLRGNLVRIDPDAVREKLPDYDRIARSHTLHLVDLTRSETNRITDILMAETIAEGKSFVFDASGRDLEWYEDLIQTLQEKGYKVTVVMVITDPAVARRRCDERAELSGRVVDSEYFQETHLVVPRNFLAFGSLADRFVLIQNSGQKPVWMWYQSMAGDIIFDTQAVKRYLMEFGVRELGKQEMQIDWAQNHDLDDVFKKIKKEMEAKPGWDLSLETSYRLPKS
jgi:predicted ABC-type ATPase